MSQVIEVQTKVLPGHRIEICAPELPEGSAATVQITVEDSSHALAAGPSPDLQAAERLYLNDLPAMLESKPGRWVAYSSQGLIVEGDDELAVFQVCYAQGRRRGEFLVACVEPDLPAAEITENWFPPNA